MGMWCGKQWLQLQWPPCWAECPIVPNKLAPVMLAAAVWDRQWAGKTVLFCCDNDAVVAVLRMGMAKHEQLLQ